MSQTAEFTTTEAAFVLREPVKAVRKALDEGPARAKLVSKPGGPVRAVEWVDLLYLFAARTLRDELTPKARSEFYDAVKRQLPDGIHEVRFGRLSVSLEDLETELQERSRELVELADKVEFRSDGQPALKGTGIEVHRIAALLAGGASPEEICQDYPSLAPEAVAAARTYARAHPKPGRPYPAKSVKQALAGAGLEALNDVLGDGT